MSRRAALNHVWVRAAVLTATFAVVVTGLYLAGATLLENGYRFLGALVLYLEMGTVIIAVFIGPAWVLGPSTGTPGDGPPRGGILPFRARTSEPAESSTGGSGSTGDSTDQDTPRAA